MHVWLNDTGSNNTYHLTELLWIACLEQCSAQRNDYTKCYLPRALSWWIWARTSPQVQDFDTTSYISSDHTLSIFQVTHIVIWFTEFLGSHLLRGGDPTRVIISFLLKGSIVINLPSKCSISTQLNDSFFGWHFLITPRGADYFPLPIVHPQHSFSPCV
jgi:hypothetical protein